MTVDALAARLLLQVLGFGSGPLTKPKPAATLGTVNARTAGKKGGRSKSAAKQAASRKNGARGGRPSAARALLKRIVAAQADLQLPDIDPGDLGLILERLCRAPNSGRRFFIRPIKGGGFAF